MERTSRRQVCSVNFDWACDVILWLQNRIDQTASLNKWFIICRTVAKNYVVWSNTAQVVKLKMNLLQIFNVCKSRHEVTPTQHETPVAR